jgi:hypothetical protein
MVQRGQDARLTPEPRESIRVAPERGRQNLDGVHASEHRMAGSGWLCVDRLLNKTIVERGFRTHGSTAFCLIERASECTGSRLWNLPIERGIRSSRKSGLSIRRLGPGNIRLCCESHLA